MPRYHYTCGKCGDATLLVQPMSKRRPQRKRCPKCGGMASRDVAADFAGRDKSKAKWPLKSWALGVHPDQIPDAVAQAKAKGVDMSFAPTGQAIFKSPKHRREYCQKVAVGTIDRDAGYSDPS